MPKSNWFQTRFLPLFIIISALSSTIFAIPIEFPPRFRYEQNQQKYHQNLEAAFKKVLSLEPRDFETTPKPLSSFDRFVEGLKKRDLTQIHYALRSEDVFTLESFISRFLFKLRSKSNWLSRSFKLSPDESAAVTLFYLALNPKENSILRGEMLLTSDCRLANGIRQITRWPETPLRTHESDQPPVPYNRNAWKKSAEAFLKLGLYDVFLLVRSQFVNFEAAQLTHRHIQNFDLPFFQQLQIVALKTHGRKKDLEANPQLAKRAFLAYLANTHSEAILHKLMTEAQPSLPLDFSRSRRVYEPRNLAEFAYAFSQLKREQLIRFFSDGTLPLTLKAPPSAIIERAVTWFNSHPARYEDSCVTQISNLKK